MTPIPVDKSQLDPFDLEWVDEEMPYDPNYGSLSSWRDESQRIVGKTEQIEHLPAHTFDNAMRERALVPWYPKTDEDIAVFRRASGSVWCKHDHDSVYHHHHDDADEDRYRGHGDKHDIKDVHKAALHACGDCGGHEQGVHGSAMKYEVTHHPNEATQAARDHELVAARVTQIKKKLAKARRNTAKQKTRLALKEETAVQLERELAEAEQGAQPVQAAKGVRASM